MSICELGGVFGKSLCVYLFFLHFESMNSSDCEADSVDSDWKKVERDMQKVGQRDGLSDGRDKNFQPSFDRGYEDGFRSGFELGKLKFYREIAKGHVKAETKQILDNASKGLCVICTTEKDNENVADVRKLQSEFVSFNIDRVKDDVSQNNQT